MGGTGPYGTGVRHWPPRVGMATGPGNTGLGRIPGGRSRMAGGRGGMIPGGVRMGGGGRYGVRGGAVPPRGGDTVRGCIVPWAQQNST